MPTTQPAALSFLAPKYWPTWFGLAILRICVFLPYQIQMWLGRQLGYLSYALMPQRKNIVETNIRLCFPELNRTEQKVLIKKSIASTGMAIVETGISWWAPKQTLMKLHKLDGLEHLNKALAKGKGAIILASHFTTLEIGGTFLAQHIDNLNVVYKRAHNPLFEYFIRTKRTRNGATLINHKKVREIIRCLKNNNVAWYSPDQDFGEKDSVFAPFMGISTCTLISTQRLAQITGAAVIPLHIERPSEGSVYRFHFSPAIENFPSDDSVLDATAINHAIEEQIKVTPEQYLWAHRRFKSRPDGEPDFYSKR